MFRLEQMWRGVTSILVVCLFFAGCTQGNSQDTSDDTTIVEADVQTEDTEPTPLDWAVDETGPYSVGFREEEVTYTPYPLTEPRTLRVTLWYPTDAPATEPALYFGAFESEISTLDAPPMGEDMPVLIFSHGHMGFAEASAFLCEHFASHGWTVIAPDHTGNTATDLGKAATAETYFWRPLDLSATLDWLYELPETDPLSGRMSAQVALAGHSFGGWTTFMMAGASLDLDTLLSECEADENASQFCVNLTDDLVRAFSAGLHDERIQLGIPLDPGNVSMFGEGVQDVSIPILLMTADGPPTGKDIDFVSSYWEAMNQTDAIWVNLTTAGHQSFGILCDIMPSFAADEGCGEAFMPHKEVYYLVNTYALAFARYHFWSDTSVENILNGTTVFSDAVIVYTK